MIQQELASVAQGHSYPTCPTKRSRVAAVMISVLSGSIIEPVITVGRFLSTLPGLLMLQGGLECRTNPTPALASRLQIAGYRPPWYRLDRSTGHAEYCISWIQTQIGPGSAHVEDIKYRHSPPVCHILSIPYSSNITAAKCQTKQKCWSSGQDRRAWYWHCG